ncbi:MAG TPA: glycosyl hydrolase family 79 C-terminal domain-containing protein [Candidatus Acidoferrales bacterium]|nr:glycosyl hydrolase family 79 C-terminal domain-containing protein [Candidatus Acidoferrales bacterium]
MDVILVKKSAQNIGITWAALMLFFCAANSAMGTVVSATVNFSLTNSGLALNPAFCGLSYDKSELTGSLFVTNDVSMIQMFSQISPAVLRIGADSVDTTCWGGLSNTTPITASEVDAFAGFIKALPTNWHVIYGINMSVNTPTNCAAEAAYAANALGSSLLGFEIGNEPDEYVNNGIRANTYTYAQFLSQWQALAAAITNTVPGWAVTNGGIGWTLTGPVSAYNTSGYTVPFAGAEAGVISMVTQHYYRGNGQSPDATMALLLQPDASLPGTVNTIASAATAAGLPLGYRTDECNSYYGGGAANVSDAYGTALWTLDFMFTSAINGCQGVNFHGGGNTAIYTPIFDNGTNVIEARPVFYGLKMFSLLPQGRVLPAIVTPGSNINFTAYGVREDSGATCAVLNNKETNDAVDVSINLGSVVTAAQMIELTGTNLASTNGYTLGGAAINPDGSWTGGVQSVLIATNGQLTITVPPMSAVLLNPMADTVFWTGASSANWNDSGNWLANSVPTFASDVVFSFPSVGNFSTILGQDTTVNGLSVQETGPISISGNSLTINSGGIDLLSASNNATINSALVLGASQNWAIAPDRVLAINGPMSGTGNLTLWQGTVILADTNNCTGTTTVGDGTLEVNGSMSNPIAVTGGILTGTGVLTGPVSISTGGTVSPDPGFAELFVSNTLAVQSGGSIAMDVNASTGASDVIAGITQLTYGGALVLNNQAGSFSATNTFKLFSASTYAGAFNSISPASPGTGLDWDTSTLATDGTLRIVNVVISRTTNVLESRIGNSTSGNNNPAFSFSGFSSTISANKSSAPGCSSPGSSRFSNTASTSTRFSVTPSLLAGTTYSVSVSWGYNSYPYGETPSIVVSPTATGVSSSTFPATTIVFSSGPGDATNNTWEPVGNITPNVTNPVITFTWVSGLSSERWYADAVRFISQPPNPGPMTAGQVGQDIILNWQGNFILQSATNVLGPYADVLGPVVIGPYTNTLGSTEQFFRLRQ